MVKIIFTVEPFLIYNREDSFFHVSKKIEARKCYEKLLSSILKEVIILNLQVFIDKGNQINVLIF